MITYIIRQGVFWLSLCSLRECPFVFRYHRSIPRFSIHVFSCLFVQIVNSRFSLLPVEDFERGNHKETSFLRLWAVLASSREPPLCKFIEQTLPCVQTYPFFLYLFVEVITFTFYVGLFSEPFLIWTLIRNLHQFSILLSTSHLDILYLSQNS